MKLCSWAKVAEMSRLPEGSSSIGLTNDELLTIAPLAGGLSDAQKDMLRQAIVDSDGMHTLFEVRSLVNVHLALAKLRHTTTAMEPLQQH
jgi:hypothetical protein